MLIDDVIANIDFTGASPDTQAVVSSVFALLVGLDSEREGYKLVEAMMAKGEPLVVKDGVSNGASFSSLEITYNQQQIDDLKFINKYGTTYQVKPLAVIIHELIHTVLHKTDLAEDVEQGDYTLSGVDYTGDTVRLTNQILSELNVSDGYMRESYLGEFRQSEALSLMVGWEKNTTPGPDGGEVFDFTFGKEIDVAIQNRINTSIIDTSDNYSIDDQGVYSTNPSRDLILGNYGNETVKTGAGDDFIYGGSGDDNLFGGEDSDYLSGGLDDDTLYGEDGVDQLEGGSGDDTLYGGGDGLSADKNDYESDFLFGGDGFDTYKISIEHNQNSLETTVIYGGHGPLSLNSNVLQNIDYVSDSDASGVIEVSYEGGDGWLSGDTEYGVLGRTYLVQYEVAPGIVAYTQAEANNNGFPWGAVFIDTTLVFFEVETFGATFGIVNFVSGDSGFYIFDNAYNGSSDDDVSVGTNDSDYFEASNGQDLLQGMGGSDTYGNFGAELQSTDVDVVEDVGAATDVDVLEALDYDVNATSLGRGGTDGFQVTSNGYAAASTDLVIKLTSYYEDAGNVIVDAESTVIVKNYFLGNETAIENIVLDDGVWLDFASVSASFSFDPTQSDDVLSLDAQNNILDGQGGDDTIDGLGGDDILLGGAGEDTLRGGEGEDLLAGGFDNDTLEGGIGADTLKGGTGNDLLKGGEGNDALFGEEGDDTLQGDEGDDELTGWDGDDLLEGGFGSDQYFYEEYEGNDTIREMGNQSDQDVLNLKDMAATDIALERVGMNASDLLIKILSSGEQILVENHFVDAADAVSDTSIEFIALGGTRANDYADAVTWDKAEIDSRAVVANPDNNAPGLMNPVIDQSSAEDALWTFTVPTNTFSDADGDALSFSAVLADGSALPSWLSFDAVTQTFTGTPPQDFNGTISLRVIASDGLATAEDSFDLVIDPVNDAPIVVNTIDDQTGDEDAAWSYTVPADAFSDVDGDTLTYSATLANDSALPTWLSFDAATLSFSGTPPQGFTGTLLIKVVASDGSATAEDVFDLVVSEANSAPVVIYDIQDQSATAGALWQYEVPEYPFSDPDGDALVITAELADGSPLPAWLSFEPSNGSFSGIPPQDFSGVLSIRVVASDGQASVYEGFELNVAASSGNTSPIVANAIADQSSAEDTAWSFTVPGDAFDDLDGDSLSYSATLADGGPLPSWLAFDGTTQTFAGTPPQNFNGTISLKVIASDGLATAEDSFDLIVDPVNDAPIVVYNVPDQAATSGALWEYEIPEYPFEDVDGDSLALSIELADGSPLPAWLTFNPSNGSFSGTPPADFAGTLSIRLIASDGVEDTSVDFDLVVESAIDIAGTSGADTLNGTSADEVIVGYGGNDTINGFAGNDTYLYELGDGNDSIRETFHNGDADRLELGEGILASEVTLELSQTDSNDITLHFVDGGSILLDQQFSEPFGFQHAGVENIVFADGTIWDKNQLLALSGAGNSAPVVANAIEDQSSAEDTAWNYVVPVDAFSDAEGDALTYSATLSDGSNLPSWLSFDAATRTFSGTPPQDFNGTISLRVIASDEFSSAEDTFDLVISPENDAPIIANAIADQNGTEAVAWNYTVPAGSFTDVDGDALTYTATMTDGSALPSWLSFDAATRSFSGTPPVGVAGTIALMVTASDGVASVSDVFDVVVSEAPPASVDLAGTSGDDTLNGTSADEVIAGYAGNDTINGGSGNDTYLYSLGDGDDTITETYNKGSADRLELGAGISASEVSISLSQGDADDVTLNFSDGGSILLDEQFSAPFGFPQSGVETIAFADGTTWDKDTLATLAITQAQTSGDDTIGGFNDRADTIEGGLGNDILNGGNGNDTFIYNFGDGNDTITETYSNGSADRLELGVGILASEVTIVRSTTDTDDVTLHFIDGGSITLDEQFHTMFSRVDSGVEQIVFADGTIWGHDDLLI